MPASCTLRLLLLALLSSNLLLAGCAAPVKQKPAVLKPAEAPRQVRVLDNTEVRLSTGYTTTIRAKTTWAFIGTIEQGDVYKPRDQVLTVEGYDVHEAYLVVSGDDLVGFYLPVEHNFAPISPSRHLIIER
jgi:hypothetical protein